MQPQDEDLQQFVESTSCMDGLKMAELMMAKLVCVCVFVCLCACVCVAVCVVCLLAWLGKEEDGSDECARKLSAKTVMNDAHISHLNADLGQLASGAARAVCVGCHPAEGHESGELLVRTLTSVVLDMLE